MHSYLIISAAEFEATPLMEKLGKNRISFAFVAAGVGALAAAANSNALARQACGKKVLFVGTAGTFGSFSAPFLCRPQRVFWLPACERLELGYGIPRGKIPFFKHEKFSSLSDSLPPFDIVCSPSISLKNGFSQNLSIQFEPAKTAENLELFSCIDRIQYSAASVDVLLGITNEIGQNAHAQWQQWQNFAAEMIADHVVKQLI